MKGNGETVTDSLMETNSCVFADILFSCGHHPFIFTQWFKMLKEKEPEMFPKIEKCVKMIVGET